MKKRPRFMPLKKLVSLAVFGGEMITNPGPTGSAIPSSRALARRVSSFVPRRLNGYVIELGAGTGSITDALLENVPPNRLILVERSRPMVKILRERFPFLTVLEGDAAKLSDLIGAQDDDSDGVHCIVSSLPLRSLPKRQVVRIVREIKRVLRPDGRFVQYTYDLRFGTNRALSDFNRTDTSLVWMNIPPARVDVFQLRSNSD